jgi:hypothetical protein
MKMVGGGLSTIRPIRFIIPGACHPKDLPKNQ